MQQRFLLFFCLAMLYCTYTFVYFLNQRKSERESHSVYSEHIEVDPQWGFVDFLIAWILFLRKLFDTDV